MKPNLVAALLLLTAPAFAQAQSKAPTVKDWTALAALPDWSGTWMPNAYDQFRQENTIRPPWTAAAGAYADKQTAERIAGRPEALFANCLPEGMPSLMLTGHGAVEFLYTPGRVTMLAEGDGNNLRRIYTDGRPHPADPDPSFHGHSIGHWEGDTLVVDTIGVMPEALVATGEAVGVPNGGDMHLVERIRQVDAETLHDDLEITAPHVLATTWKTTRIMKRIHGPAPDILEGVCRQGDFNEGKDAQGNAVFVPRDQKDGNVLPTR